MSTNNQKKIWQQEAQQLKEDLANRPKEVLYQPKEIKLNNPNKIKPSKSNYSNSNNSKISDDFLRNKIGI